MRVFVRACVSVCARVCMGGGGGYITLTLIHRVKHSVYTVLECTLLQSRFIALS